jgi:hypothetical protein
VAAMPNLNQRRNDYGTKQNKTKKHSFDADGIEKANSHSTGRL